MVGHPPPPPDLPMGLQWLASTVIVFIKHSVVQCNSVHKIIVMYRYINIIVHYHAHC